MECGGAVHGGIKLWRSCMEEESYGDSSLGEINLEKGHDQL